MRPGTKWLMIGIAVALVAGGAIVFKRGDRRAAGAPANAGAADALKPHLTGDEEAAELRIEAVQAEERERQRLAELVDESAQASERDAALERNPDVMQAKAAVENASARNQVAQRELQGAIEGMTEAKRVHTEGFQRRRTELMKKQQEETAEVLKDSKPDALTADDQRKKEEIQAKYAAQMTALQEEFVASIGEMTGDLKEQMAAYEAAGERAANTKAELRRAEAQLVAAKQGAATSDPQLMK